MPRLPAELLLQCLQLPFLLLQQLLLVLDVYAEAYNAMVKSELMPDRIDSDFNAMYDSEGEGDVHRDVLTAEESDMQIGRAHV